MTSTPNHMTRGVKISKMARCYCFSMQSSQLIFLIATLISIQFVLSFDVRSDSNICRYEFKKNHSIIDLKLAVQNLPDDGFSISKDNMTLYYNPCQNIVVKNIKNCTNVVGCYSNDTKFYFNFGDVKNKIFELNETTNQLTVSYTSKDKKSLNVTLQCSEEVRPKLEFLNKSEPNIFAILSSKCCCPDGCLDQLPHPSSSLSTGSVLVIILAIVVFLYFIGGMLFLHFIKGANGLEMIPHYDFWIDLPVLIKDGIVFALNGCKPEASYDRI